MINGVTLIAEVKTQSPFGFRAKKSWDELFAVAEKVGDIISIHTDPRWGGSFDLIKKARAMTKKPILAKGIHATDEEVKRAIEAGADFVLVVGRVPSYDDSSPIGIGRLPAVYIEKCLIEPLTLSELKALPKNVERVVWNSRDLNTGGLKKETFEEARKVWKGSLCQASNVKTLFDVKSGADAVLVGEHLEGFVNSL
jgi:indole-3-glycerol phosphate synthase